MAKVDGSPTQRRRGGLWAVAAIIVVLAGVAWLSAPSHTTPGDTGARANAVGVIEMGPKPSSGLSRPGAVTQGLSGTDSRDNGTPNAGRTAPASDPTPTPAPAPPGPPSAGSLTGTT